jgi:hypothetical protein
MARIARKDERLVVMAFLLLLCQLRTPEREDSAAGILARCAVAKNGHRASAYLSRGGVDKVALFENKKGLVRNRQASPFFLCRAVAEIPQGAAITCRGALVAHRQLGR